VGPANIFLMRETNLKLMTHQLRAVEYVKERKSSYLALDMGLGKTAVALSLPKILGGNMLVICPGYLRDNWFQEALMWGFEKEEVQVILSRKDKLQYRKLTICSYDPLSIKNVLLSSIGYTFGVLDEAHYLRGRKARRTKLITGSDARIKNPMHRYCEKMVWMSGTPMLSRPRELWPILRCTYPDQEIFVGYYRYAQYFCQGWNFGEMDDSGATNQEELKENFLSQFMLRICKEDVLDLPEKIYTEIDLELTAAVKRLLEEERELGIDMDRLLSGEPVIGEYATMRRELGNLKLSYCVEHIKDILDQTGAVVVFTYHQQLAIDLAEEFGTTAIIGSTPNRIRTKIVSEFQDGGGVFVGSYGAAGTGITLTKASHVVLCELEYSPRLIDQAVDRCHRIGQTKTVNVYTLLWSKGLERTLWQQLQEKDRTFQNLFGG